MGQQECWCLGGSHRAGTSELLLGFPGGAGGKESSCSVGDLGLIPELGRSPEEGISYPLHYSWASLVAQGEGNGTPLQSSSLENPMDGGAWWAAVHGVADCDPTERLHFHFSFSCIGEGNGNPLQCSCLENPRDGGAWGLPSMRSHRVRHD